MADGSSSCGTIDLEPTRIDAPTARPMCTADHRKHEAFGKELANDAPPIRAERRSDRQFARAHGCARQEQVRDVGAADEQDEPNDAKEQQRRLTELAADDGFVQWCERDTAALVRLGEFARQSLCDSRQVGFGGFATNAGLQAPDDPEKVCRSRGRRRTLDRGHRPNARPSDQLRLFRHDADDVIRRAIEQNAAAHDAGVRIETRSPERFAQDDNVGALAVVRGQKCPANDRPHAERVEDSGGHPLTRDRFGDAVRSAHHHAANAGNKSGDDVERSIALVPIDQIERRDAHLRRRLGALPKHDQTVSVRKWKRPQQGGIDQRKHGAVGANAECEREHRRSGEARLLTQRSHRVVQILPKIAQERPRGRSRGDWGSHVRLTQRPHRRGERVRLEQFLNRETSRVGIAGAVAAKFVVSRIEVLRKLFDNFRFARRIESQLGETRTEMVDPGYHAWSSPVMRSIACTKLFQVVRWRASTRRPSPVRL